MYILSLVAIDASAANCNLSINGSTHFFKVDLGRKWIHWNSGI